MRNDKFNNYFMNEIALKETVSAIFSSNRGILATDATADTMDKRMTASETAPTPELRVKFREVLLTTPGISEFIGGVILNDEIIRAKTSGGENFFDLLDKQGIKVGIKLDKKTHDMANFPGEKIAEGLDGLRDRLKEYKDMKVSFAKFRTVYLINDTTPSQANIESNSEVLARYAALCQEAGIVPIVEPEVLMDGSHAMERCMEVTTAVLRNTFFYLNKHKVSLAGMILKPNMVLPGKDHHSPLSDNEVAITTLEVLKRAVPAEVPVIAFLSGGQEAKFATARINEMVKLGNVPWQLSFSFERALEGPALDIWKGLDSNIESAQKEFFKRAKLNSIARMGQYDPSMES